MELDLKGKNILFIAPVFYDYHTIIKDRLVGLGANVFFYPERDYSLKFSFVSNFLNLEEFQTKHYSKILEKTIGIEFDYLFVIKGYKISNVFIEAFRAKYPKATLIMHQWDSHANNPYSHLLSKFDVFFSFDKKDIETYPTLKYLPNFYLDDILSSKVENDKENIIYDIFFIASFLPERYRILMNLKEFADENNLKLKVVLYASYKTYIKEFLKGNRMNIKYFIFSPLKREKYLMFWAQSKAIFDISSEKQTGLSQRVIETIEGGKKLITNNKLIAKEEFYSPEQVLTLNENGFNDIIPFLNKSFTKTKTNYSLDNWLFTIFSKY